MKLSKIFCCASGYGCAWFRIFGYGLHFKNLRKADLLFSQRNGLKKYLRIGRFVITILKPEPVYPQKSAEDLKREWIEGRISFQNYIDEILPSTPSPYFGHPAMETLQLINRSKQLKAMSDFNAKKRQYPITPDEAWLSQPEPMFPIPQLREAYLYYHNHAKGERSAENFFNWLYELEKGIPFDQQKHQP